VFVYFFGLTIPLLGPDEPRYSQVAREMFERGDWVTPTLGGFHWFEKPALLYWLQIAAYKLFGVSEFSARLGSALFGLGTILSLWVLGKSFTTETQRHGEKEFAHWLGLIAASSIGIIVFSRGASFDIILTFPMTAALVSFYLFDSRVQPPATAGGSDKIHVYVPLFAFYFFIGVALLAKGLVGILFPFAIVGFYYLLSWRFPGRVFILSLIWGTVISVAVAATWYLPMYQRNGWEFIDEFFIQHHFQRYTSNKYFHPQPFYFFFWVLPLMTIPWLPFFVAAIWDFGKKIFHHRDTENTELKPIYSSHLSVSASPNLPFSFSPLLLFSFAWMLVPLVFFSFSGSKLPGYILPALPPTMIIAAVAVFGFIKKSETRARMVQATAIATFVVVVALLLFVVPRFADSDSVKSLIATAAQNGYDGENVLTLHTVSHNAEFYASGRLLRDSNGKQKKLLGVTEVLDEIKKNNSEPVLVLVPLEYLNQLRESTLVRSKVLKDNGELAIVYVQAK
jgi:4-amino-4-deoxy-L-arabinose transferase-like glycosyltransferase